MTNKHFRMILLDPLLKIRQELHPRVRGTIVLYELMPLVTVQWQKIEKSPSGVPLSISDNN